MGVMPLIRDRLGNSDVCNDVDVSIETSQGYTCLNVGQSILAVQIKKGSNDVNVSGVKFYVSSGGNSVYYTTNYLFSQNSYHNFYLNLTGYSNIDKIEVVPVADAGKSKKDCTKISVESLRNCSLGLVSEVIVNETAGQNDECVRDSDCGDVLCQSKSCVDKKCQYSFVASGTAQPGLCDSPKKCDGGGNCVQCLNAGECPAQECKEAMCSDGSCQYNSLPINTLCAQSTGTCNSLGICINFIGTGVIYSTWTYEGYGYYQYFDPQTVPGSLNEDGHTFDSEWNNKPIRFVGGEGSDCTKVVSECTTIQYIYGKCWPGSYNCIEINPQILANHGTNNNYGYTCNQNDKFYVYSDINTCNDAIV